MKIEKRKMTMAAFVELAKAETDAMTAAPDAERAAMLKRNLAVAAAVEKADAEFEVEVAVKEEAAPQAVDLGAIAAKIDQIAVAVAAFGSGVTAKAAFDAVVAKQALAVQLALEMLAAHQAKVAALAAQLQAGGEDLDREAVFDAMRSWPIENALEAAMCVMGKAEGADAAALAEVGAAVKAAALVREEAAKAAAEVAAKAAEEAAAKQAAEDQAAAEKAAAEKAAAEKAAADAPAKADVCAQCGADMAGEDVCPACGWKRGAPVSKRSTTASAGSDATYRDRYTGKPEGK